MGAHANNDNQRVKWHYKAAKKGDMEAQYKVALHFQRDRSSDSSRKFFKLAAEQGHVDAMVWTARYAKGPNVRSLWLNRAADKGHPELLLCRPKI